MKKFSSFILIEVFSCFFTHFLIRVFISFSISTTQQFQNNIRQMFPPTNTNFQLKKHLNEQMTVKYVSNKIKKNTGAWWIYKNELISYDHRSICVCITFSHDYCDFINYQLTFFFNISTLNQLNCWREWKVTLWTTKWFSCLFFFRLLNN